MEITGSHTFPAPVERVYAALLNADLLAQMIPNCERLIQFGPPDADGATQLEARIRTDKKPTTQIAQVTVRPYPETNTIGVDLRWHEDAAGEPRARAAGGELRLDEQGDTTVSAWELHTQGAADDLSEVAARGFADALFARIDATLTAQGRLVASAEMAAGGELFVRTPYGTIAMARSEPVWGSWLRTALLLGGVALALGGLIALGVTITRALSGRRDGND
jgi:uncharacterized protein YndB with AHSA1/START domain